MLDRATDTRNPAVPRLDTIFSAPVVYKCRLYEVSVCKEDVRGSKDTYYLAGGVSNFFFKYKI